MKFMHYNFSWILLPSLYYLEEFDNKRSIVFEEISLFLDKKFFQCNGSYHSPFIDKEFACDLENTAKETPSPRSNLFLLEVLSVLFSCVLMYYC